MLPMAPFENYQKVWESFIKFRSQVQYAELTSQFFKEYMRYSY